MTSLKIGYFYPEELNLYGDTGNIEILAYRASARGFSVDVTKVDSTYKLTKDIKSQFDIVFMGGGPDSSQKKMYTDLLENKGPFIKDYINDFGVTLLICGSYQLLGHYYKSLNSVVADGSSLNITGVGALDLYTVHYGHSSRRCVGNIICTLADSIAEDAVFKNINKLDNYVVGFENHGGLTYLNSLAKPLSKVVSGFGNNLEDKHEGVHYKNTFGTYLHGPLLANNPHIVDFIIAKALKLDTLEPLEIDAIINKSHTALVNRFK